MSQSTFIAGALLAAFVLFLAARNRLSTYAAVLWGSTAAQVPQPSLAAQTSQSIGGGSSGNPLDPILKALPFLETAAAAA